MDKIKTIKIKNEDGSISEETYTISVDALNVDMDNGKDLQDTIGNINVDTDGNISEQLEYLNIDIKKKAYFFNTVVDMKNANLKNGDYVCTLGYNEIDDGGAADYKIIENNNYNIDNGKYHILNNGLIAKLIIKGDFNVKQFGAYGDNTNDDTVAIQNTINCARTFNNSVVIFPKAKYKISNSIIVYGSMYIDGQNSTIIGEMNKPIIKGSTQGSLVFKNFDLQGADNEEYTENDGINIVCYYSTFENIKIRKCYHGIFFGTTGASGTLVENKILDCKFSGCIKSLYLGGDDNNKLTDGILENIIINQKAGSTNSAVVIGSCAGWVVSNIHIYGGCSIGIYLKNAFHTVVDNIYIEGATYALINCGGIQTDVNFNNITGMIKNSGQYGITFEASSYRPFDGCIANFNNIAFTVASNATNAAGLYDGLQNVSANVSNYKWFDKSSDGSFKPYKIQSSTYAPISSNANLMLNNNNKKLTDMANDWKTLQYGSSLVSFYRLRNFEGSGAKTINFVLDRVSTGYGTTFCDVELVGFTNWDGSRTVDYKARVYLVSKNGTIYVRKTVDRDDSSANIWTTEPTFTFDKNTLTLTISFELSVGSTYGTCCLRYN